MARLCMMAMGLTRAHPSVTLLAEHRPGRVNFNTVVAVLAPSAAVDITHQNVKASRVPHERQVVMRKT